MITLHWNNNKIAITTSFLAKYLFLATGTQLIINDVVIADKISHKKQQYSFEDANGKKHNISFCKKGLFSATGKYSLAIDNNVLSEGINIAKGKLLRNMVVFFIMALCAMFSYSFVIVPKQQIVSQRILPLPQKLVELKEKIGSPRVVEIAPGIFVALGFEFTNTILIKTPEGNIIVDTSISPVRARQVKEALMKVAPGKTKKIIFTHSHIDHIGGANEWVEDDTEIWATDAFVTHTIKQYGIFNRIETMRGNRQFGLHVSEELLPCFALGARVPTNEAQETGLRLPTHTFSGIKILKSGTLELHLIEAHGETHDQLFVWIPERKVLLAGDNFYDAFPNIYTIRGTKPRPVDEWIKSIDMMRTYEAEVLIPGHTLPLTGKIKIQNALRDYRDGIQWIRDSVVRLANEGKNIEEIVAAIGLPQHLTKVEYLTELYGQIDWSVRAIYGNELGWFDGRADKLYPMPLKESAQKEIELMGGFEAVLNMATTARTNKDYQWSIHLLAKLRDSQIAKEQEKITLQNELAQSYQLLGETVYNTNGRAYLLETAHELKHGYEEFATVVNDNLLAELPVQLFFENMCYRLIPEKTIDIFDTFLFEISDIDTKFFLTIRYGVAELAINTPLPGTPTPKVIIRTDSIIWKQLALKKISRADVFTSGKLQIKGDKLDFIHFSQYFKSDL